MKRIATWLICLALLWSALWYGAAHLLTRQAQQVQANLRASGQTLTCSEQSLTGFPLAMHWQCRSLGLTKPNGAYAHIANITLTWQATAPFTLSFAIDGPITLEDQTARFAFLALTRPMQGHLSGLLHNTPSLQLTGTNTQFVLESRQTGRLASTAQHLTLKAKLTPEKDDLYQMNVRTALTDVTPEFAPYIGLSTPMDMTLVATASKIDLQKRGSLASLARHWQELGGHLTIAQLRIRTQKTDATGQSKLTLSPNGYLTGEMTAILTEQDRRRKEAAKTEANQLIGEPATHLANATMARPSGMQAATINKQAPTPSPPGPGEVERFFGPLFPLIARIEKGQDGRTHHHVRLTCKEGSIQAGLINLGRIPRLFISPKP